MLRLERGHVTSNAASPTAATLGTGNVGWDGLFGALAEVGFDGRFVLDPFVRPDPEVTRLAALWRDVADDPGEPLREGMPFRRAKAEEHGPRL